MLDICLLWRKELEFVNMCSEDSWEFGLCQQWDRSLEKNLRGEQWRNAGLFPGRECPPLIANKTSYEISDSMGSVRASVSPSEMETFRRPQDEKGEYFLLQPLSCTALLKAQAFFFPPAKVRRWPIGKLHFLPQRTDGEKQARLMQKFALSLLLPQWACLVCSLTV